MALSGSIIVTGTWGSGAFISMDNGSTWKPINNGITDLYIKSLTIHNNTIYAGTKGNVFISSNNGSSWTKYSNGLPKTYITGFVIDGTNVIASTINSGIYLSANDGKDWTAANNGLTNLWVNSLTSSGTNIFAGTNGGVFLSTNSGSSWISVDTGLTNKNVNTIAIYGTTIFAGTDGGVYTSTTNGNSWTAENTGLPQYIVNAVSLTISGTNIFLGTNKSAVWKRSLNELVSMEENTYSNANLKLFPNPNNGVFSIRSNSIAISIEVYNLTGQLIYSDYNIKSQTSTKIDLSNLQKGIYFARMQEGKQVMTEKIVIQ